MIGVKKERNQVDVSLRPSRIFPDIEAEEINEFADIKRGQVYEGFVSNIAPSGVFVKLNHSIAARVKIANLSDSFVKEWKDIYKEGQLVKAKVIYIDHDLHRLEASLKKSVIEGTTAPAKASKKKQAVESDDSDEEMPEVDDSDEDVEDVSDDEEMEDASDKEESEEEDDAAPASCFRN